MGWSGPKSTRIKGFSELHEELQCNKSKKKLDRTIANETVVRIARGTMEAPEMLIVQHYRTDILWFWKDGSFEVNCDRLSDTTIDRISSYSNCYVTTHQMPTVNGFLPNEDKVQVLCMHNSSTMVPAKGKVRVGADGKFDMSTVKEIKVEVIADPKAVRKATRHLSQIGNQLHLRRKLGVYGDGGRYLPSPSPAVGEWLVKHVATPLEKIDYSTVPDHRMLYWDGKISGLAFDTARAIKATKIIPMKILPTQSFVL